MVDGHWFGGGFMWLFWILLIVVILLAIKMVAESGNNSTKKQRSALDVLKERYARGEINEEEYEQKKKVLDE